MGAEHPARADLPGRHPALPVRPPADPRRSGRSRRVLAKPWPRRLAEGPRQAAPSPRVLGRPRRPPRLPAARGAPRRPGSTAAAAGRDAETLALPRPARRPDRRGQTRPPGTRPAAHRPPARRGGGLGDRLVPGAQGRHGHRDRLPARRHRTPGRTARRRGPRRLRGGRRGPAARPAARPPVRRRTRHPALWHRHQQHPALPLRLVLRARLPRS